MVKGTFFLTLSQLVLVGVSLILHPFLGRRLGPEMYGIFGVISNLVLIVETVLLKGIYDTIAKFVAEKEGVPGRFMAAALKLLGFGGLMFGAAFFLLAGRIAGLMNDPGLVPYIRLSAFFIPAIALTTVFLGAINGMRQFGRQAVVTIVCNLVRLVAIAILVLNGLAVRGAVIGLLAANILRLILVMALFRPVSAEGDFDYRQMSVFALQLLLIAVVSAVLMNIDLLVLKALRRDNFQTGLYTCASTIAKMPRFLIIPVSMTVLPILSRSFSGGREEEFRLNIERSLKLALIAVLPVSLVLAATGGKLIALLYGRSYLPASAALVILMAGTVFLSVKVVMFTAIIGSGHPRSVILVSLISLAVDLSLLSLLIGRFGLTGAAWATTISHAVGALLSYAYVARKYLGRALPAFLLRIFSCSAAVFLMALLYAPKGVGLMLYYGLLALIYALLLLITGEIDWRALASGLRESRMR